MKRTDFSVDWLFAACAPDTELLPWNAQFTPVDLPHDWQIRHADDLYRDGTLFYRKYFFVTDVPGTRRMLWFGGAYMDTTVFVNGTEVGTILYKAHNVLETITIDKDAFHFKESVAQKMGELVYDGKWFTPLREALSAFTDDLQKTVTGDVKLKLYKGNLINAGVTSPFTLYDEQTASFGEDEDYDQFDANGFINLFGLPIAERAKLAKNWPEVK